MKMNFLRKALLMSFYTAAVISLQLTLSGLLFANTGYGQKSLRDIEVSVDFESVDLKGAFQKLETRTEFTFAYKDNLFNIAGNKKFSKRFKKASMAAILESLSKSYSLHFKRIDNTINVKPVEKPLQFVEEIYDAPNQQRISGVVKTADTDEALPGVSIIIKGTTSGTTTNINGEYTINASSGDVLQYSYIGYQMSEVEVGNQSTINVSLEPDLEQLEEVVVVGYGTQARREVTGAISSVKSEELEKMSVQSFDQALQGRAPGVVVTQNSGEPGGGVSVRVRGVGSFGNNEPLYVIDGFPVTVQNSGAASAGFGGNQFNSLAMLNPKDIESIEVLKDASAASIYGARAANGVVLITTKRGKSGQATVNLSVDMGLQEAWRQPEFLNAAEFAELANEAYINAGETPNPEWANPGSLGEGTNWVDELFRTGLQQDYNLGIQGGNEKMQASINFNYFNQEGILIESGFDRYSFRSNLDFQLNDKIKFGTSSTLSFAEQQTFRSGNFANGLFNIGLSMLPTIPVDGFVNGPSLYYSTGLDNPVIRANELENFLTTIRSLNTAFMSYEILPGLTYRLNVGADLILTKSDRFDPLYDRGLANNPDADLFQRRTQSIDWLVENTLNYNKSFGDHNVDVLVGQTAQNYEFLTLDASATEFLTNDIRAISLNANPERRGAGGGGTRWSLASYIGRFRYNFKDKYLFSASVRVDGSSRFGANNRFGTFPSLSAGWRVSEEDFFQVSWIDDLKFRASYGVLGGDRIGDFARLTRFSANTEYTLGGGAQGPVTGVSLAALGNPNLRWEESTQVDFGIDAAFFDGRVTFVADYFVKDTDGLLVPAPPPTSAGVPNAPLVNAGLVRNRGLEVALGYRKANGDFTYDISANFATLDNEVISIGSGQPINGGTGGASDRFDITRIEPGFPVGYFFGFQTDGIYQTADELNGVNDFRNPQPGDLRFVDTNGRDDNGNLTGQPDGQIDNDDRTIIGNPIPDLTYGLNVSMGYKNFDFTMFWQGVAGRDVFNVFKQQTWQIPYFNGAGVTNSVREVLNRWTGPGTSNEIPRIDYNDVNNYPFASEFYVEDGSFVRLRNLQIGYTLPQELTSKLGVQRARFYVGGQNLITITDYSGFDPEIGDQDQSAQQSGVDNGVYPLPRIYRAGLNFTF